MGPGVPCGSAEQSACMTAASPAGPPPKCASPNRGSSAAPALEGRPSGARAAPWPRGRETRPAAAQASAVPTRRRLALSSAALTARSMAAGPRSSYTGMSRHQLDICLPPRLAGGPTSTTSVGTLRPSDTRGMCKGRRSGGRLLSGEGRPIGERPPERAAAARAMHERHPIDARAASERRRAQPPPLPGHRPTLVIEYRTSMVFVTTNSQERVQVSRH